VRVILMPVILVVSVPVRRVTVSYIAVRVRMGPIGVSVAMHHVSMGVLMSRVGVAIAVGHVVVLVVVPNVVVADALLLLLVHPRPEAVLYPVAARAPRYLARRWAEDEPLHTVLVDVVEAVTLNPVTAGQGARLGADRITDEGPPVPVGVYVVPCISDHTKLPDAV